MVAGDFSHVASQMETIRLTSSLCRCVDPQGEGLRGIRVESAAARKSREPD